MAGMFGFGLGVALMWAEIQHGSWIVSLLVALALYLVFRLGRRDRTAGATAVATAVAQAKAQSTAASQAHSTVNVFVAAPPQVADTPNRWPGLDDAPWLKVAADDRAGQRAIESDYQDAAQQLGASDFDDEDPVEVLQRAQLGDIPP